MFAINIKGEKWVSLFSVLLSWHGCRCPWAVHPSSHQGRSQALRWLGRKRSRHGLCSGEGIDSSTRSFHASCAETQKVGQKTVGKDRSLVQMREKRACGMKRGEDEWTKNLVDLALKGGIKCDGYWIAPWTLLIRGGKYTKTPTPKQNKSESVAGQRKRKWGRRHWGWETARKMAWPDRSSALSKEGPSGMTYSSFWCCERTEDFEWSCSKRHPQSWGKKMESEEDSKTHWPDILDCRWCW